MLDEVSSAAKFLKSLLMCQLPQVISQAQLDKFSTKLQELLITRFESHWYPAQPFKGSGYRCIRINRTMDPVILQACKETGLDGIIPTLLPPELTVWIDPQDVAYRFGEEGSICKLDLCTPPTSPKLSSPQTSPVAPRREEATSPQTRQKSAKKRGQKKISPLFITGSVTSQRISGPFQTSPYNTADTYFQSANRVTPQRSPKLGQTFSEMSHFPTISVNA